MSIDQIDEYEQGERIRSWLKNNGSSLLTGIGLGLAAIAGWNWWDAQGDNRRVEAASQYATFASAIEAKDEEKVLTLGKALGKDYADTPYAALSALRSAEFLHSAGKLKEALALLEGVDASKADPAIAELISLRIAGLMVASGQHEQAVKRLDSLGASTFPAVANELRGDAEMARGNRDAARKAYEAALTSLDVAAPTRALVEMKLTDAGGRTPDQPEI